MSNNKKLQSFAVDLEGDKNIIAGRDIVFKHETLVKQRPAGYLSYLKRHSFNYSKEISHFIDVNLYNSSLDNLVNFDDFIKKPLFESDFIVFLGNSGSGKTTLCSKLFFDLANIFLSQEGSSFAPISIKLGNYSFDGSQSIIKQLLLNNGIPLDDWYYLVQNHSILFIIDGLDEVPNIGIARSIYHELRNILLLSDIASKVFLTSRKQFFKSSIEESQMASIFAENGKTVVVFDVKSFNDSQILYYLSKRIPDHENVAQKLKSIYDLWGLSKTPLLLKMITEMIEQKGIENTFAKNKSDLYMNYTDNWFQKEEARFLINNPGYSFPSNLIRVIIENIAFWMYFNNIGSLSLKDIESIIAQESDHRINDAAALMKLFRNNSFFIRVRDDFRFMHKSFMEYFVAKRIVRLLSNKQYQELEDKKYVYEVLEFLKYMIDESFASNITEIIKGNFSDNLRQAMIELIGTAGLSELANLLVEISENDVNSLLKTEAMISLGYLDRSEILEKYVLDMNNDSELDDENNNFIIEYYGGIEQAREFLHLRLLDNSYEKVRSFHLHCLIRLANENSLEIIRTFFDHPDDFVRNYALVSFDKIRCRLKGE